MRHLLALAVVLGLAVGCGKEPGAPAAGTPAPPVVVDQSGPSAPAPIDPATVGSVYGVVTLDGWIKPDKGPDVRSNAFCSSCHPKDDPPSDTLILGEGNTMANVLVHVKEGLGRRSFQAPTTPVVIEQTGCIYVPHVQALQANQPLLVRSNDHTLHNVNGSPKANKTFNIGQDSKGDEDTVRFPNPELSILVKCDVHPWMRAYIHVVGHPFFKLTGTDGAFSIGGLPPGDYVIEAIHEKFPDARKTAKVTVGAKQDVKLDFKFQGGPKPPDKK